MIHAHEYFAPWTRSAGFSSSKRSLLTLDLTYVMQNGGALNLFPSGDLMIKNPFLKLKLEMISPQSGADMKQTQTEDRGNVNRPIFCVCLQIFTGRSCLTISGAPENVGHW